MKNIFIAVIVILLFAIGIMQYLVARGVFPKQERQEVCPVDAISMVNGKAVIDSIKCIGCRRCVDGFVAIPDLPVNEESVQEKSLPEEPEEISEELVNEPLKETVSAPNVDKLEQKPEPQEAAVTQANKVSAYYTVASDECISCGFCLRVCPVDAISYKDGKAFIDKDVCIACGICAGEDEEAFRGCPVDAISRVEAP
ncbi:MAG: 4Fe-4S binding protein [Candidatus Cloacimonadaceae bacterium]|jgi:ferredoxin|nr:4Fe-4S binding protein [Candidatus Cloacimonadota bacterium]MCK9335206.1 4Fe-4S binding protein [Candidatus Cloacimonadota bacterium]HPF09726.1 4Fe-4S binding protein [Candidatus Cloacimonadota bacterium]